MGLPAHQGRAGKIAAFELYANVMGVKPGDFLALDLARSFASDMKAVPGYSLALTPAATPAAPSAVAPAEASVRRYSSPSMGGR